MPEDVEALARVDPEICSAIGEEVERQNVKVLRVTKAARAQEVDLYEVLEVFEPKPATNAIDVVGGKVDAVLPR